MSPSDHTIDAVLALFRQAGRPLSAERAGALAREIAIYGGLDQAVAALAHDEAFRALDDALAYRALLNERDDPDRLIVRLLRQAGDLEAQADPAWAQAADWRGRAAFRRARDERALAARFEARALAAERIASELEEQALNTRLRAAELKAGKALHQTLRELAA